MDLNMKNRLLQERALGGRYARLRYWWSLSVAVFKFGDPDVVRLILAWASFVWVLSLGYDYLAAGHGREMAFERPAFFYMSGYAPQWMWIIMFLGHWIGVHWAIFTRTPDPKTEPRLAWLKTYSTLAINALGLSIWLVSTLSLNIALDRFTPTSGLELIMCVASAWALYRTDVLHEQRR